MALWNLANPDHTVTLNVDADNNGVVKGHLVYEGISYPVNGRWKASGTGSGINYSGFSVLGNTGIGHPNAAPTYITATGIMYGSGANPTRIEIQVDLASSADGKLNYYQGELLPA